MRRHRGDRLVAERSRRRRGLRARPSGSSPRPRSASSRARRAAPAWSSSVGRNVIATPSSPGRRLRCPAAARSRWKSAKGTCVRMPAPSPVRESAPTPPRWVRLTRPVSARSTISREGLPAMSTTRPTPHESCSNAGLQEWRDPAAGRGAAFISISPVGVHDVDPVRQLASQRRPRGLRRPHPECSPIHHSIVGHCSVARIPRHPNGPSALTIRSCFGRAVQPDRPAE